jgi:hypothetical protein
MATLTEVKHELADRRKHLSDIFRQAGTDIDLSRVTLLPGTTEEKTAKVQELHRKINELGQEHDRLALLDVMARENEQQHRLLSGAASGLPTGAGGRGRSGAGMGTDGYALDGATKLATRRDLRAHLLASPAYKAFREGAERTVAIDLPVDSLKTLITLSNVSPQNDRRPLVPMGLEARTVGDLMVEGATTSANVEYYEETTNPVPTVAQGAIGEGAPKFETAFGWTLRTEPVRKIATWVPATKEALDDVDFLESQLRGRLAFAVQRIEEQELLTGTGVAPQFTGLLNRAGIQTVAKGAAPDTNIDVIYRAMQLVRGSAGAGFAEPTAVVFHPTNWSNVKSVRTADGIYIWGSPAEEGPDRIWGLPVRQTTAITVGTALVGAFQPYAARIVRERVTVTLSTEHSTFFTDNKVAILAEERLALAVYRASAFATATSLS